MKTTKLHQELVLLEKSPTGIKGLDEITFGGLPKGRPTLVCGNAGCGKTLFGIEFLYRGATEYNEPGVFMSFEETEKELTKNVASLGFDLEDLVNRKMLIIEHVQIERSEIEVTGEYDLAGLFIRLNYAIDTIGAKRVVLDTIESLFAGLPNPLLLRSELRRLFRWLKDKGVTAIITGESGDKITTRQGLEEYVSDCVIVLDHRVTEQLSTRRLRVSKYRGSLHGTNEFPFLIDDTGFVILPITSLGLDYKASSESISSGIPRLDTMLGGQGYFRGSSILVSGTAGSGKSSTAANFAVSECMRGEKVLYVALEESPDQIMRNMRSIGIDLQYWLNKGLLKFFANRPTFYGLEMHLSTIMKVVREYQPRAVIVDPINSFAVGGNQLEAKMMIIRLIDFLKQNQITGYLTNLTTAGTALEHTDVAISSSIDTWLLLRDIEYGGERTRGMYILKSRGMNHSNQIREFILSDKGVQLLDIYSGNEGVLTGSARLAQEAKENVEHMSSQMEIKRQQFEIDRNRKAMEAHIDLLKAEFEAKQAEAEQIIFLEETKAKLLAIDREKMVKNRHGDASD